MHYIHCLGGEQAEETATLNFGRFIIHVLDRPNIAAKLVTPKAAGGGGGFDVFATNLLSMYASTPLQRLAVQNLKDNMQMQQVNQTQQQSDWASTLSDVAFTSSRDINFEGLESLLGLL